MNKESSTIYDNVISGGVVVIQKSTQKRSLWEKKSLTLKLIKNLELVRFCGFEV